MSWYKQGEFLIAESNLNSRLRTWTYNKGVSYVPIVFLSDNKFYGEITYENNVKIKIDDFYRIPTILRDGIKSDFEFRANLTKITWDELYKFRSITNLFEESIKNNSLDSKFFLEAMEAHGRICALVEFNSMLPLQWYKDNLYEMFSDNNEVTFSDFAFSEVIPHRILIRWAKLRLYRDYLKTNSISKEKIKLYIENYGYLEPTKNLMDCSFNELYEMTLKDLELMKKNMSKDDVKKELNTIYKNRINSRNQYNKSLNIVIKKMKSLKKSEEEIENFIGALTIISLASTEEEFRHIIQSKFWKTLGIVLNTLEVSKEFVTCEQISKSLSLIPNIKFDFY